MVIDIPPPFVCVANPNCSRAEIIEGRLKSPLPPAAPAPPPAAAEREVAVIVDRDCDDVCTAFINTAVEAVDAVDAVVLPPLIGPCVSSHRKAIRPFPVGYGKSRLATFPPAPASPLVATLARRLFDSPIACCEAPIVPVTVEVAVAVVVVGGATPSPALRLAATSLRRCSSPQDRRSGPTPSPACDVNAFDNEEDVEE